MLAQKSSACRCTLGECSAVSSLATVLLPAPGGPDSTITCPRSPTVPALLALAQLSAFAPPWSAGYWLSAGTGKAVIASGPGSHTLAQCPFAPGRASCGGPGGESRDVAQLG